MPPARCADRGEEQHGAEPRLRRPPGYQLGCVPERLVPTGGARSWQGQVLGGGGQAIPIHTEGELSGDGGFRLGIWRQQPAQLHRAACGYGILNYFPQYLRVRT